MGKTIRRNSEDAVSNKEFSKKKSERRNRHYTQMSKSRLGYMAIANHITSDMAPQDDDYDYSDE